MLTLTSIFGRESWSCPTCWEAFHRLHSCAADHFDNTRARRVQDATHSLYIDGSVTNLPMGADLPTVTGPSCSPHKQCSTSSRWTSCSGCSGVAASCLFVRQPAAVGDYVEKLNSIWSRKCCVKSNCGYINENKKRKNAVRRKLRAPRPRRGEMMMRVIMPLLHDPTPLDTVQSHRKRARQGTRPSNAAGKAGGRAH